jgi:membrane protease YdiL (CAAX protease family)
MSRTAWLIAVIAAMAVVWIKTPGVPLAARTWTVLLLVPLPALMIAQARQLRDITELPRRAAYISSIVSLWALAVITIIVAAASRFAPHALGFFAAPIGDAALWIIALTSIAVGLLFAVRALGVREAPILEQLLPVTRAERVLFAILSLSAGVCEELAFRGFLLHVLTVATGSQLLAVVLSSGAFGVVHAYQQPSGALRAALLGALLASPLLFGMPIYVPIIVHILIDLLSGLWLARHLLRPH